VIDAMDDAGIDRAVIFPPFFIGHRNRYTIEQAAQHPDRFRVMPRLDLRHEAAAGHLDALREHAVVAGLRLVFTPAADTSLDDAEWLWPLAEREAIPIMLLAPREHEHIRRIATRHPGLRLALDHMNLSGEHRDDALGDEIDALVGLADLANVSVKASALPCYSNEAFPYKSLHRHVERVVAEFGPERVFWGSDLSRLRGSYVELIRLFRDEFSFLDDSSRVSIMGRGLLRWLDWPT
jgi:predicted TIM-barrel fold metal-dependent hydrolase